MASRRPGRYLKTFLEPVAPFSQSMSPYRPTTTPFIPKIVFSMFLSHPSPTHFRHRPIFIISPYPDLSLSEFWDRIRHVRHAYWFWFLTWPSSTNSGESSYAMFRRQTYKNIIAAPWNAPITFFRFRLRFGHILYIYIYIYMYSDNCPIFVQ